MPTTPRDGLDTLSVGGAGTYDCHAYYNEKKRALQLLAAQIDRIINPQDNVVPMRVRGSGMTRNVSGSQWCRSHRDANAHSIFCKSGYGCEACEASAGWLR
jgi:hypothetical protein